MRAFYVTTTRTCSNLVREEILRLDFNAAISYRRENRTLLLVHSATLIEDQFEKIPGVSHAVSLASLGKNAARVRMELTTR